MRLADAGVASPGYDARALLAHVLGVRTGAIAAVTGVSDVAAREFERLVAVRCTRVPLQHLTGVAGFRRLDIAVGPGVFVPRPETEVLIDWAVQVLGGRDNPLVVDLGAGSGAIALAVADEAPAATVHAVEREQAAVGWARRNLAGHPAGARVTLHQADIDGCLPELSGRADLVLANPPYIPDGAGVEREVAEHDPPAALWGGPDGLAVVRVVARVAARLLRPGGHVAIEHADLQGDSVPRLLERVGAFTHVADQRDLTGRPRFAVGVRKGSTA